jgi:periplasmic divalent cation tolerance protein
VSERETAHSNAVVILSTFPSSTAARKAVREIVNKRFSACGNVIPGLTSLYWWEGEVQEEQESLALFKTSSDRADELVQHLLSIHPYECPEAIVLPITGGNPKYLAWMREETHCNK